MESGTAEGKMVKGGKWTVLSVQSGSVVFVALIAKHSVVTADDNH